MMGSQVWAVLEQAIGARRRVRLRYHVAGRVVYPHVLCWKNGHAKALSYQVESTTNEGRLPDDPRARWRSMFVEEIEGAVIVPGEWQSASKYSLGSNCVDVVHVVVSDRTTDTLERAGTSRSLGAGWK